MCDWKTKPFVIYAVSFCIFLSPTQSFAGPSMGVETSGSSSNGVSVKSGADQTSKENKKAENKQNMMGALMMAMAAAKFAECPPINYAACVMGAIFAGLGAQSLKQAKEHGRTAQAAGQTSALSDGYGAVPNSGGGTGDLADPRNPLNRDPHVAGLGRNIQAITNGGYYNPATGKITLPNGQTFKASDFSSVDSMIAAGIPKGAALGAVEAYNQALKKVDAKYEKLKLGSATDSEGFSGGGSSSAVLSSSEEESAAVSGNVTKVSIEREPANLAGLQKNFNGEPIGVAEDSIFLMMSRRYKVKESQDSFF
ncbi:hypothetical protein [Bdellovibrio bacteriovorus]|uniref:hypothetical protein n=1 Tax=Bdellovibrio TaxID=958 RepID=UPI0035A918FD